ncbi:MAG TPA: putative metal-binding motif-containing protein [Polyangiaceae bacterium]|nr:putative metal-binding motif-containing protein [Polyangiaceae bacterium]
MLGPEGAVCAAPFCGDGKVQAASEECDDGNDDNDDGCTELCRPPTCGDGLLVGDEQCDDGNDTGGDGCEADCTHSCDEDAQCNDNDPCNGEETCDDAVHSCAPGVVMDCSDSDTCTEDTCDTIAGCQHSLIDSDGDGHAPDSLGACGNDCNDNDPSTYVGAAELCDGNDNNCNGDRDELAPTWYKDCDGDGFAAADATSVQQCDDPGTAPGCPQGSAAKWTSVAPTEGATDCYDSSALVYPRTQEQNDAAFNPDPIPGRSLTVDFDYNCDGAEETALPLMEDESACVPVGPIPNVGWICAGAVTWTSYVPACGESAPAITCSGTASTANDCLNRVNQVEDDVVQSCR